MRRSYADYLRAHEAAQRAAEEAETSTAAEGDAKDKTAAPAGEKTAMARPPATSGKAAKEPNKEASSGVAKVVQVAAAGVVAGTTKGKLGRSGASIVDHLLTTAEQASEDDRFLIKSAEKLLLASSFGLVRASPASHLHPPALLCRASAETGTVGPSRAPLVVVLTYLCLLPSLPFVGRVRA